MRSSYFSCREKSSARRTKRRPSHDNMPRGDLIAGWASQQGLDLKLGVLHDRRAELRERARALGLRLAQAVDAVVS